MVQQIAPPGPAVSVAARLFRSLGDPTRLALLLELASGGERRVSDLVARVGTSQSNVSGHLACLKECGLVADRPDARRQVFYRIAEDELYALLAAAERLLVATGSRVELCHNPLMDDERPATPRGADGLG